MLLSRDAIAAAVEACSADDFYKPAHGHIFDAITSLYGQGEPVDPVTVADELRRAELLDPIGGPATLISLQANTPATANAGRYARIVEEHALLRRLIGVAGEIAEMGYSLPDDITAAVDRAESMVFEVAERRVTDTLKPLHDLLADSLDRLEALYDRGESITGVPTGFLDLDERLSGLQKSNLVIIGARPSMGKTALALGMAANAAMEGQVPVLYFSLEMSHSELTQRLLCSEARVDSSRVRNGKLLESDWPKISHAIGRLGEAPLYIDDNPNLTVMEVRAKARRLKSRLGQLGVVFVDYLQLMSGRSHAENRQVEVSEISRGLKILARELECPVVALSQLSRNLEMRSDKRPVLADLRESGCLTADSRVLRADTGAEATMGELFASGERDIPVWTLDEDLRLVHGTMTHVFASGIKDVFQLRLASGRQVTASANHPFLTLDGWTRLDELQVGHRLAVPRSIPSPPSTEVWPEGAIVMLAHLLSDGKATPTGGPGDLPPEVFSLCEEQIALLLCHLWGRGGTIRFDRGQTRISYASANRSLVDGIQSLLLRLRIQSRIRPVPHWGYRLGLLGATNQLRFLESVGFHRAKGERIAKIVTHLRSVVADSAPSDVRDDIAIARPCERVPTGVLVNSQGYSSRPLLHGPGRCRPAQPTDFFDDDNLRRLCSADVFWDEVIAIVPRGSAPVYDATVTGTHNFIANGITVENSLEQDADVVMFLYRDEVYNPESPERGTAEIIVSKHRNGPTGVTQLAFLDHYTRFANMARV
jgi:replicative DNA helicase